MALDVAHSCNRVTPTEGIKNMFIIAHIEQTGEFVHKPIFELEHGEFANLESANKKIVELSFDGVFRYAHPKDIIQCGK